MSTNLDLELAQAQLRVAELRVQKEREERKKKKGIRRRDPDDANLAATVIERTVAHLYIPLDIPKHTPRDIPSKEVTLGLPFICAKICTGFC